MGINQDERYQSFTKVPPDVVMVIDDQLAVDITDPELGHENFVNALQVAIPDEELMDGYLHKALDYWHESKEYNH